MLDQFYAAVAQASFTLLALFWVLLQIRHDEWIRDTAYRRSVYDVSLYFLLPGMMSLASLLAVNEAWIWRVSFAVFGIVGAIESVLLLARRGALPVAAPIVRAADLLSLLLYSLVALVAIWESLPSDLSIDLRPLELQGLFVTALLLLGITLAAALFVTTGPQAARPTEPRWPDREYP
jgi:hypothetical protein